MHLLTLHWTCKPPALWFPELLWFPRQPNLFPPLALTITKHTVYTYLAPRCQELSFSVKRPASCPWLPGLDSLHTMGKRQELPHFSSYQDGENQENIMYQTLLGVSFVVFLLDQTASLPPEVPGPFSPTSLVLMVLHWKFLLRRSKSMTILCCHPKLYPSTIMWLWHKTPLPNIEYFIGCVSIKTNSDFWAFVYKGPKGFGGTPQMAHFC